MTDFIELDSMFQRTNLAEEPQYEKVEFIQLADEQGGVYDSGEISWNTMSMEKSNACYAESYAALPLRIGLLLNKKIAVKNSVLALIHGATITSSAGTTIINETSGSTASLSNLKLLIDSSTDFHESNELMFFGKDESIDPDPARNAGSKMSAVGGPGSRSSLKAGALKLRRAEAPYGKTRRLSAARSRLRTQSWSV